MEGQRVFLLTNDQYAICQVIEAIPDNWHRIEGSLSAPEKLVEERRVAKSISMFLRQPHPYLITKTGIKKGSRAENPDYEAVLRQGKPCQFVEFDVINGSGDLSLALVKSTIINYVRCCYTGYLRFFSKQCGDNQWAYPYLCDFRLTDWLPEGEGDFGKTQPPAILLKWNT
ncbi:MAG: hypothetical protein QMD77_02085 [Patescibacteria group bacterium]|nr:hypothetical protein [Patescibacteria group bacterium]